MALEIYNRDNEPGGMGEDRATKLPRSARPQCEISFLRSPNLPNHLEAHAAVVAQEDCADAAKSEERALYLRDMMLREAGIEEMLFFTVYASNMLVSIMHRAKDIPELAAVMAQYAYATKLARDAATVSNNGGDIIEAFGRHRLEKQGRLKDIASVDAILSAAKPSSSLGSAA